MISKNILSTVIAKAMSTGADFAEVYAEKSLSKTIKMVDCKVNEITDSLISGVGIRILKGSRSIYASTTLMTLEGLLECASKVADAMAYAKQEVSINLNERIFGDIHPISIVPSSVCNQRKIDILKEAYFAAKDYHHDISQVMGTFHDVDHNIMIANSEGLFTEDRQIRTRIAINAIASKDGENQTGTVSPGRRMGLEMFDMINPKAVGEKAAKQAITMINASYCPAGKMTVAIENGFGGVIFHEACGHSLEASCVSLGQSQFVDKLGKQIANPKVTAIDDGTIPNAWGSINIDDEGTKAQRNVLIENGILKSYLVDKRNGRRLQMESTGSARRQSYLFEPTSRMTNTYIDNGPDKNEDIIKSMEYGLYAKAMGGGSVNTVTGEFNFAVLEGYLVKNGEIKEAVRGASLIGKGSEILMNIDMVGKNLERGQGMCGAASGSIPTDVGQPLVRVSSITVGGR